MIRRLYAQSAMELRLLLRNGENLLATLGIPIAILVFFSLVHVLPSRGESPVDFLVPGVLALSVVGAAMVSMGIATGFERYYRVLKRLGATPLRRGELIAAKVFAILATEVIQVVLVVAVGLALGWHPYLHQAWLAAVALLLGTAAFAGIGLGLAGSLRAIATLAVTNGLFMLMLLISGIVFPLDQLPSLLRAVALALPAAPLTDLLRASLGGAPIPWADLVILAAWAAGAPLLATRIFRWE
ncbi:MAG: ABC transporter permease [Egibacteraceae bacterium]